MIHILGDQVLKSQSHFIGHLCLDFFGTTFLASGDAMQWTIHVLHPHHVIFNTQLIIVLVVPWFSQPQDITSCSLKKAKYLTCGEPKKLKGIRSCYHCR